MSPLQTKYVNVSKCFIQAIIFQMTANGTHTKHLQGKLKGLTNEVPVNIAQG